MKSEILLILFLSISLCFEENSYSSTITFSNSGISSSGEGVDVFETNATITKAGSYLATGTSNEGNIIINADSVSLYLENLELSSSKTSPIIIKSKLNDVKIIAIQNIVLKDLEDSTTTTGECATIKIKKKSKVTFENKKDFKLIGKCKNVIKGGAQATIIFASSNGEYIINANKTAISSDGLLTFKGGIFTVNTETGDAIKSDPEDSDTDSLGHIIIEDGTFNVQSYSDAFQAKNKIIIKKGTFDIKTENGYKSNTFNKENGSAKGFKVSNNITGCEIRVYNGKFTLDTADDAFHSNGNLTLINGDYEINTKDDGLHAEFHLLIGTNDSSTNPNINILNSYEGIEGMSIRIYSGKINVVASDDGINAAGGTNNEKDEGGDDHRPPHILKQPPQPDPHGGGNSGNSSYFISIYGGEINVFCDGDGFDSNGNIFIHGGDINIFSKETGDNEPLDHDGNFTLFGATLLGVGSKGMEYVHEGISKGNQMSAYYSKNIQPTKKLKIKNGNGEIVKEGNITKKIDYIFYTSQDLNKNYKLYICNLDGSNEIEYTFSFSDSKGGSDDQDNKMDDGGQNNDDDQSSDDKHSSGQEGGNNNSKQTILIVTLSIVIPIIVIIILIIIFKKKCCKKNDQLIIKDDVSTELAPKEIVE